MRPKLKLEWVNFFGGGLILYVMGFFFLFRGGWVINIALSQVNWVETTAVVTRSETSQSYSQGRYKTNYHFQYTYVIDDQTFQGHRYSAAQLSASAIQGVRQFDVGQTLTIYYNPKQPSQAVVMRRWPSIFVGLGLTFGGFMVWFGTNFTLYGDIGGPPEVSEEELVVFGQRFLDRHDEPIDRLTKEVIVLMPRALHVILNDFIDDDDQAGASDFLRGKTGLPDSLCQNVLKQIEQKRKAQQGN